MSIAETVLETPWFKVEALTDVAGVDGPYYQVSQPDGIVTVTITEEGAVLLVRQYRPPLGRRSMETPAGFIDGDESPIEAARREIYEETGYLAAELTYVGRTRSLMNRLTSCEHVVLARGARRDPAFEPTEAIEIVEVDRAVFRQMVIDGEFEQTSALGAMLLIQEKLDWRVL